MAKLIPEFLYDKDQGLTTEPFTLPVMIQDKGHKQVGKEGYCYVRGPVQAGAYLCSSYLLGVAMPTNLREVAFGRALESYLGTDIHRIKFELLKAQDNEFILS